jgi:DNA invertase Pin-like site-specific DNA recombinase
MIVGYARTSTIEQVAGFEAQKRELEAAGCERIFEEQVSSVGQREQLERALEFVREGDSFVVTKLDRLARSVMHLGQIVESLKRKGVALRILNLGIDTSNPTGELVIHVMGSIAQFERAIMLQRQRDGIAAAKAAGKFKGREPKARRQDAEIKRMVASGMTRAQVAKALKVSERSVYRVLASSPQP